jgi:hypothetical protein
MLFQIIVGISLVLIIICLSMLGKEIKDITNTITLKKA